MFFKFRLHGGKAKLQYPNVIMGRSFAHRRTFATKTCFTRVIPTVTNYFATVSDISSGSIYIYIILTFLSGILPGIYSDILSGILSGIYSDIFSGILSGICPDILSSGILSGIYSGILSDMGTAICRLRLMSGSAHCDLELAVPVWQCPLRSGAGG